MFTNYAACMVLIACLLRLNQTSTASLFYQVYFTHAYPTNVEHFTVLSSAGSMIGGPLATFITGFFVDKYG